MRYEWMDEYLLAQKGVTKDLQADWNWIRYHVGGKMFAALNQYKKQSFYEEHKRIVYETLHGQETYEVMFAFTTPVYTGHDFEYYAFSKAHNVEEYDAYISACRERALYDTGVTARYGDKLLTLSTCEYSQKNGRMVVVARKIDE